MRIWALVVAFAPLAFGCSPMAQPASLAPSLAVPASGAYCYSRFNFEDPTPSVAFAGISFPSWGVFTAQTLDSSIAACGAQSMRGRIIISPSTGTGVIQALFSPSSDVRDARLRLAVRFDPPPPPDLAVRFVFIDQRYQWVTPFTAFSNLQPGWNHLERSTATQDPNAAAVVGWIIQVLQPGSPYDGYAWFDEISW